LKFGCCAGIDKIQLIQDMGFDYIEPAVGTVKAEEPDSEFKAIAEKFEACKIVPEAWMGLIGHKMVGPEVDMYRIERYLRTALHRVKSLGGEVVVFGSGGARRVPDGFPMEEAQRQLLRFVELLGEVASDNGITIAIEHLNKKETNTINTLDEALDYARIADRPSIKVLADYYHLNEEGEPLDHVVEAGPLLAHTHTADTDRLYPGSGSYDHKAFFTALRDIGYDKRLSVECIFKDFEKEAPLALEFLRSTWNG
jgi:sugar phosphate isomerase/epimerase